MDFYLLLVIALFICVSRILDILFCYLCVSVPSCIFSQRGESVSRETREDLLSLCVVLLLHRLKESVEEAFPSPLVSKPFHCRALYVHIPPRDLKVFSYYFFIPKMCTLSKELLTLVSAAYKEAFRNVCYAFCLKLPWKKHGLAKLSLVELHGGSCFYCTRIGECKEHKNRTFLIQKNKILTRYHWCLFTELLKNAF